MIETSAQRTLVKSPPELWAEISDAETLARHLSEFGEIRITRTEPESTVAWEGETARGTVELKASGWGTKVTLTAEVPDRAATVPAADEPEPEAAEAPVALVPERPATVPAEAPGPDPEAEMAPEPRRRLLVRLLGRWGRGREIPVEVPAADAELAEEPVAVVEIHPAAEPALVPDEPDAPEGELRAGEPVADRDVDADRVEAVLTGVLDDLGAAHHRPFSRP